MSELTLLILLSLATYRAWRIIGRDTWPPSRWFRSQVAEFAEYDPHQPPNVWNELVDLIECPWCLGAWIAAVVVAWTDLLVGLELPVLWWLAVSCAVGLIGQADG